MDDKLLIDDYAYYRRQADSIARELESRGYTGYYIRGGTGEKKGLLDPGTRPTEFVWEKEDDGA